MMKRNSEQDEILNSVQQWVKTFVVNLDLCPFANTELSKNDVRFTVSAAASEEQLLTELKMELELLTADSSIATTLLIHPLVLQDFERYNQFLSYAETLVEQMALGGVYQIASFHPNYQFAGTDVDAAENYTNRSPYPMLHLIREDSLSKAIDSYSKVEQIPQRNIELMRKLGTAELIKRRLKCFD